MRPQSRSEIAELLERHGLTPIHRLGQHFLADANITTKIVAMAGIQPGDSVVEVGAGTGTLTAALAEAGAHVIAYEVDGGLRPVLEEVTAGLDVDLRFEDIMDVDLGAALDRNRSWKFVANLPYNVGTPLVLDAMRHVMHAALFVVMVQKEVASRFCAHPGSRDYGLPSVVAQIHTEPRLDFTVPPQVFFPAPRVESAVLVMPRIEAPPQSERAIELAGVAFRQRRKMLRRSLADEFPDAVEILGSVGIAPTARAEDLAPEDFLRLAGSVS
ncbi:16S rRNA (adenine(1518)-N(6)/adenine(1519)-N(6))-dimethyltransferaseRsmA [soil metagenome]